jgi:hypothetical protein
LRTALRSILTICVLLLGAAPALAEAGPRPPCAGAPEPAYAGPGALPATRVWYPDDLAAIWRPPECTGWPAADFGILVAAAARFPHAGDSHDLLRRIGEISKLATVRYWSVTRKRWRDLITEAHALRGPDRDLKRPDFGLEELLSGEDLYFWQVENSPAGGLVYRMRLRGHAPDRIVLEIENAHVVRFLGSELFAPGAYRFLYFLERESPRVWRYYGLMRTGPGSRFLIKGFEASYVNRMVAIYRHLAGIPTDREPPAAP